MKNGKIIGSIIFFIISGLFFVLTYGFPTGQSNELGPSFMPRMYASFLFFLSIILLFQGIKENSTNKKSEPIYKNIALVALIMFLFVVYVFLIPYLGFYLVSIAFMVVFLKITQVKNLFKILLVSGATNLFIFIFFQKMLHVPVPVGSLFS